MTPERFAQLMKNEIVMNEPSKGDFSDWDPDIEQAFGELCYHIVKLRAAVRQGDKKGVVEHGADVGNYAMKIVEKWGDE